jgi:hypothetical protein
MVINVNTASVQQLQNTSGLIKPQADRLSSGQDVNAANSESARLAISDRMLNQLNGLNMAERRASPDASSTQPADNAGGLVPQPGAFEAAQASQNEFRARVQEQGARSQEEASAQLDALAARAKQFVEQTNQQPAQSILAQAQNMDPTFVSSLLSNMR